MLGLKKRAGLVLLSVILVLVSNHIYAGDIIEQAPEKEKALPVTITFSGYISGTWQIWSINPDGTGLTQITHCDRDVYSPSWSSDGTKLAYSASDGEIWIQEQDKTPQKLNTPSIKCSRPSWSPDGSRIAFISFSFTKGREESDIWIADLKKENIYKLLDIPGIQNYPKWSPNGNFILCASGYWTQNSELREELWIVDIRNKSAKTLIFNEGCNTQPSWSPDSKWIAFASDRTGNMEIWVVDQDGKAPHQLTHNKAYDADPCWSPDGESIGFVSTREGKMDIWCMDKNGMNERNVTHVSEADCKDPFWK